MRNFAAYVYLRNVSIRNRISALHRCAPNTAHVYMMAANGLPTVQPIEVSETVSRWNTYRQGTLICQDGKRLAVVYPDVSSQRPCKKHSTRSLTPARLQGSGVACKDACLRPVPPTTSLFSTQLGQLLELRCGDRWRTVVCAQDADLSTSQPQKLKVVTPGGNPAA
jgi:hypothetical protein